MIVGLRKVGKLLTLFLTEAALMSVAVVSTSMSVEAGSVDKAAFIEKWQQTYLLEDITSEEQGVVGRLYHGCVKLFSLSLRDARKYLRAQQDEEASLKNCLDMLRLWGNGFDAERGESDRLLQKHKDLQNLVLLLLRSIGKVISQGKTSLQGL